MLVLLNLASLVAIVALAHVTLKRLARLLWAPLVTAALIASPLIWYGRVALSEELSAFVILAAVAAALLDADH